MTDDDIVDNIQRIRVKNNILWMNLLRLALKAKPKKAREIIQQITKNDREISKWTARLR